MRKKSEMLGSRGQPWAWPHCCQGGRGRIAPQREQVLVCWSSIGDALQDARERVGEEDREDEFHWCARGGQSNFQLCLWFAAREEMRQLTLIRASADLIGQVDECCGEEQRQSTDGSPK